MANDILLSAIPFFAAEEEPAALEPFAASWTASGISDSLQIQGQRVVVPKDYVASGSFDRILYHSTRRGFVTIQNVAPLTSGTVLLLRMKSSRLNSIYRSATGQSLAGRDLRLPRISGNTISLWLGNENQRGPVNSIVASFYFYKIADLTYTYTATASGINRYSGHEDINISPSTLPEGFTQFSLALTRRFGDSSRAFFTSFRPRTFNPSHMDITLKNRGVTFTVPNYDRGTYQVDSQYRTPYANFYNAIREGDQVEVSISGLPFPA